MRNMTINFNGQNYLASYNEQTGYFELEIEAPNEGGVIVANITYTDELNQIITDTLPIQVFSKQPIKIDTNKKFMWIFNHIDFSVIDIVEMKDFDINIDEETNAKSIIQVLKKVNANANDIICVKKNNDIIYWGIIDEILNEDGKKLYEYYTKYITNLFDRKIELKNENMIRTTGVEDFIASTIIEEYIENEDGFVNLDWLEIIVKTHTTKQTSVSNVENGIYNLHTWLTNCTQKYNIVYSFEVIEKKLVMTIENKTFQKEMIDTLAQSISSYTEVFETDVVSKVVVLYDYKNDVENHGSFMLFLLKNRTTTTDMTDENRAIGKIETVYTRNYEDAYQVALDAMKANLYNHNITFKLLNKYIKVGTPIAIKTKESIIYDSYISAIRITSKNFYEYICGNIRTDLLSKLSKERRN